MRRDDAPPASAACTADRARSPSAGIRWAYVLSNTAGVSPKYSATAATDMPAESKVEAYVCRGAKSERQGHREPVRRGLEQTLGSIALLAWLKRASRDDYTPEGTPALNEHDLAVLQAANALASDERLPDDEAISELVLMAGRHRNRLRKAEIAARRTGRYQDFAVANRAQRLLKAAATDDPVSETSASDRFVLTACSDRDLVAATRFSDRLTSDSSRSSVCCRGEPA